MTIDINCDMGESFGQYLIGNDAKLLPYITSANIACGFHGGDPVHIDETIRAAVKQGVRVGAHPSYPDLAGFGRRYMAMPRKELVATIKYQIAVIKALTESHGGKLGYVKPHGALYNRAAVDEAETLAIVEAVGSIDPSLALMGLAGSTMEAVCKREGVAFVAEAFADRSYEPDGTLMVRSKPGSLITDPASAAAQVLSIVLKKAVPVGMQGATISVFAQSICIHGDNPAALDILKMVDKMLLENKIQKRSFVD